MANLTDLEKDRINGLTAATQEIGLGTIIQTAQTDITTAASDLAATTASKGASLIGIQDAGALITATTVEGALAENRTAIDAIEAQITDVATDVGLLHHVKIDIATGAAGDTDKALPTGTWDVVDCYVIMRSAGETSDTVRLYKKPTGSAVAISDAMSAAGADNAVVRAASIDDDNAEGLIGGTDALRVTTTDNDAGSDVAAMEVHVTLRKVA